MRFVISAVMRCALNASTRFILSASARCGIACLAWATGCGVLTAQTPSFADYTQGKKVFPRFWMPYQSWHIPAVNLGSSNRLEAAMVDGKLRLSLDLVVEAVVENNLAVEAARYYVPIAQTDLLRSRSGASPRGVDVSTIPSAVFAGAQGGSILAGGGATGAGGLASNAGGINGTAGAVNVRPAGLFDPTLNVSFSIDHTLSPLNSLVVAGVPNVTTATGVMSVNYVQAFPTGTSVSVAYTFERQGSTQHRLLFDPFFVPGFTASVNQQLLNGRGTAVNKALIRVAENEQKIERESFREQLITSVANAQNAYWDLVAANESVRAAQEALTAAQQLAQNSRRQFEIGTMARLDVVTADAQVAASQRDLIVAQTNVQNAELQLKAMLTKSLDEPLASAPIETTDAFPQPENAPLPALPEAVASANQKRPEISIDQGNIKSQEDVMPFLRSEMKPTLNAFALVSTVGLYDVFGTSFSEAIHFRYPQVAFGLTLTFSVRNRQAQADNIRARMELDQAKDSLARTEAQIQLAVKNALIAATQSRARVASARDTVRLEQQKLDAEQQKLNAGLSTSYNVVLAQRDLLAAQLAEVQALDAYAKARVALDQSMGTTLETRHVDLDAAIRGRLP